MSIISFIVFVISLPMRKFSILIAEDDPDDRFLLKKAFEENKVEETISFVENGIKTLEYLKTIRDANHLYPNLIILDLNMPLRNGKEVLQEIKEDSILKKIPVVIFSTSNNEAVIDKCYELGANTYIVKPLSFGQLLKVVAQIKSYWLQIASLPL
jgi:two-component system response regulator